LIWSEIKQLWDVGLREYISDMWNVVDFITNSLYVATIALRITAYYDVSSSLNHHNSLYVATIALMYHSLLCCKYI
jgi:hypothetical protein